MEWIKEKGRLFLLDVAHTPESVKFVLNNLKGKGWTVFLSLARDKAIDDIMLEIFPFVDRGYIKRLIYAEQEDERFLRGGEFLLRCKCDCPIYIIGKDSLCKYLFYFNRILVIGSHSVVGGAKRCLQ